MAEDQEVSVAQNVFSVGDCEIVGVVVYQDRAEVTRKVSADLKPGKVEVVLNKLSEHLDSDSIRVEGQGSATIAEVSYQEKPVTSKDESNEKRKALGEKLKELKAQVQALEDKKKRIGKQKEVLDGLADVVKSGGPKTKDDEATQDFLGAQFLGNVSNFLEFYFKQATELDESLSSNACQIADLNEEIKVVNANLRDIGSGYETMARETNILLDVKEEGSVTLLVSYVIHNASWYPMYDIRAFSDTDTLKVQYHGMISQSTGEDWNDAKISLSTATPSVGGTVPYLGTMNLGFPRIQTYGRKSFRRFNKMAKGSRNEDEREVRDEDLKMNLGATGFMEFAAAAPAMDVAVAEVVASTTTAHFEVSRKTTIPADNTSHKVTIAMFDLTATFEYECIPKKAAHAFFKAKVTNTSQYAMLAGDASIFLDNNFIAKSFVDAVSPSEEFGCSLGVDNGVRVTYKPLHKFRENSGLISKTTTETHHQVIEIKNTHTKPIKITVSDHFPKTSEAKIKVHLIEPVLIKTKGEEFGARLNSYHNVEWVLSIAGGATEELTLKYSVESPFDQTVEVSSH